MPATSVIYFIDSSIWSHNGEKRPILVNCSVISMLIIYRQKNIVSYNPGDKGFFLNFRKDDSNGLGACLVVARTF